jgi:hypothetical protein
VAAGLTNKEIAVDLGLAVPTVERHVVNIYTKIGARGRVDATAYALRHGLARLRPNSIPRRPSSHYRISMIRDYMVSRM